jgi:serine/threonine kinase 17
MYINKRRKKNISIFNASSSHHLSIFIVITYFSRLLLCYLDGLKLCDFGFSRAIEKKTSVCEIQGTPDYVSPEVVRYEPLSLKSDIWSIGVLAYVLLSGFSPFGSEEKQETFLNITQCNLTFPDDLFGDVSDDAIDFIKCTLRLKPK